MSNKTPPKSTLSDNDIENALLDIAVKEGRSIPLTEHQLEIFSDEFAAELMDAQKNTPKVDDLLERANIVRRNNTSVLHSAPAMVGGEYKMAARNGATLSDETVTKMNNALKSAKHQK